MEVDKDPRYICKSSPTKSQNPKKIIIKNKNNLRLTVCKINVRIIVI